MLHEPLNKRDFYETHVAYWLALIHYTCSSSLRALNYPRNTLIKSLLHKLPLNRAAGKDGIFAEHIFYADSSVCNHLSSLFCELFRSLRLTSIASV